MIQVVITKDTTKELKGMGKNGKPYHLQIQVGHAFTIDPDTGEVSEIPEKFEMMLDGEAKPFARGKYQLADSSIYVGRDGRLGINPRLIPIPAPAKA